MRKVVRDYALELNLATLSGRAALAQIVTAQAEAIAFIDKFQADDVRVLPGHPADDPGATPAPTTWQPRSSLGLIERRTLHLLMQQRESTRVRGFDVDQERIQGCQGEIQAALALSAIRTPRRHVPHGTGRSHRHCSRVESEFENSVRARSVGSLEPSDYSVFQAVFGMILTVIIARFRSTIGRSLARVQPS
jgi:hypothetical protein